FSESITGLSPGTGYSFVAFATNSVGTTYTSRSDERRAGKNGPTVTSPTDTALSATTVTLGGDVTSAGGASLSKRGVLYAPTATDPGPTLGDGIATEVDDAGPSTGVFSESITGLSPGTGYSFVAFATNSVGTTYTS